MAEYALETGLPWIVPFGTNAKPRRKNSDGVFCAQDRSRTYKPLSTRT